MASSTITEHSCDKCGKKLPGRSDVDIRQSLRENGYWDRLHITIERRHGIHNNGSVDPADLCQKCAIALVEFALEQLKAGIRVSEGVQEIGELRFSKR